MKCKRNVEWWANVFARATFQKCFRMLYSHMHCIFRCWLHSHTYTLTRMRFRMFRCSFQIWCYSFHFPCLMCVFLLIFCCCYCYIPFGLLCSAARTACVSSFFQFQSTYFVVYFVSVIVAVVFVSRNTFINITYSFSAIISRSCLTLIRSLFTSILLGPVLILIGKTKPSSKWKQKKSLNTSWEAFYLFCFYYIAIQIFKYHCAFIPICFGCACMFFMWSKSYIIHRNWHICCEEWINEHRIHTWAAAAAAAVTENIQSVGQQRQRENDYIVLLTINFRFTLTNASIHYAF